MAGKVSVNGGRIRKVTITEIEDEKEWNWPENENLEEDTKDIVIEKTTEEIFDELEDVVQDWKKKLEFVVADGLKKIKRSTKEKKTMMKYLPGDGTVKGSNAILKAKTQILAEWEDDINKAIDATHKKLNDLGHEKIKETANAAKCLTPEGDQKETKNDCKAVDTCLDMKTLMKELDVLYQRYNDSSVGLTKVPIYNVQNVYKDIPKTRNVPFPWWKSLCTLAQMADFPRKNAVTFPGNTRDVTSLLQDFVADQKSRKNILNEWNKMEENKKKAKASTMKKDLKTARRGRNSILKMKERKDIKKCKQFFLKEIENKGEKHYFVVKKEVQDPSNMTAVEDIFADWNSNFSKIKRPRTIKPRVRKISHRAERKEMLIEAKKEEEVSQGPLSYSQMVRKNLKIPTVQPSVEEIFGSWMKCINKMNKVPKESNATEDVEIFKSWNFIFSNDVGKSDVTCPPSIAAFECGQPTVPKINTKVQRNAESPKFPKKENKPAASKSSKKQSIEKLSEKLLVEGYPLKKSEKVEKVLDMAEKKKEKNCKAKQCERKETSLEKNTLKAPILDVKTEMVAEKQEQKIEQPVVLRNKMQVVPFVEKKSEKTNMEELFKKMKTEMPKVEPAAKDFKPSEHSQRCLVKEVITQNFIGPINKPDIPKKVATLKESPRAKKVTTLKESPTPKPSWSSLVTENVEQTGRGEMKKYKTEEIFDQWRHIFVVANKPAVKPMRKAIVLEQDIFFMEWLRNLDEPIMLTEKRQRSSNSGSGSEGNSPKPSKKAVKKQLRNQDIEDDATEIKDNRRHDFMKNTMIRDKKRTEASRNSLGKRVK
eukprot:GFUD01032206.1.p1 GENE.GFUD01032206.1~~GFUD01032206.1.p1  ORF type:complete len:820 (-),score=265.72 GFUD01032206.1:93-2552(-)